MKTDFLNNILQFLTVVFTIRCVMEKQQQCRKKEQEKGTIILFKNMRGKKKSQHCTAGLTALLVELNIY